MFNSGVIKQGSERYVMVCRAEDSALGRYLWIAESSDGIHFKPRRRPLAMPRNNPVFDEYCGDTKSYWDPRITEIEGQYYITHAAHTRHQCQIGLFKIDRDFECLEWLDLILPPDNRNGVLFPEKIRQVKTAPIAPTFRETSTCGRRRRPTSCTGGAIGA